MPAASVSTGSSRPGRGRLRYRLAVASRALAAVGGGYALAAGTNVVLARALRGPQEEVIALSTMPSFLLWAGVVVWVFAARTAGRAWLGLLVPGALVAAAFWCLRAGGIAP